MAILPRVYGSSCYYDVYGDEQCGTSGWSSYGRWIVLAVIIIAALLIFFLFSCLTARRRRRQGIQPYRGTGWALGRAPPGHGQAQYNPQPGSTVNDLQPYPNNSYNPPPAYQTENAGYYGAPNVELQQPQTTYKPPQGPPPGRY